jgi:hypothetical protein
MRVIRGENDLATTHPNLAAEAFGWDPSTVMAGTGRILDWQCAGGHVYKSNGANRLQGQGCPSCATHGYDPGADGWLYLIRHPVHGLLQVGITNEPEVRLGSHRSRNWEVVDLRGPMEGSLARAWEKSILQMLKSRGASFPGVDLAGTFSGYTESWVESTFPASSVLDLIGDVEALESESVGSLDL